METRKDSVNLKPAMTWKFSRNLGGALLLSLVVFANTLATESPVTRTHHVPKFGATLLKARWRVLHAGPLGMYYYYPDSRAEASLRRHVRQMTVVAPQSFWVDAEGIIHGEVPVRAAEIAQQAGTPVMPLVVNPGFDRNIATALLHNTKAQERAIAYLVYLANRNGFVGWQFDLENIDPTDKDLYAEFVQRAAARLHQEGRLLSIAVVPRFSDTYPNPSEEFHSTEWGAPYDYRALGQSADFITLMTYDHHGRNSVPGPIAGYDWVKAAIDYTISRVPRDKLLLGLPLYGREWIQKGESTSARTLTYADARRRIEQLNLKPLWHERWLAPWFQYTDSTGFHTGWYEDSRSLRNKLALMRKYRLRGFAAWRVGVEDPRFWTLLSAKSKTSQKNE